MLRILSILVVLLVAAYFIGAQAPSPTSVSTLSVATAAVSSGCPSPTSGYTIYCYASDKFQVSADGASYVVIWGSGAGGAGVSSIVVCNALTSGCGNPMTGAVTLSIPKTATTTLQ